MQCLDRNPLKRPTIEQIKNEYFGDVYVTIAIDWYTVVDNMILATGTKCRWDASRISGSRSPHLT